MNDIRAMQYLISDIKDVLDKHNACISSSSMLSFHIKDNNNIFAPNINYDTPKFNLDIDSADQCKYLLESGLYDSDVSRTTTKLWSSWESSDTPIEEYLGDIA